MQLGKEAWQVEGERVERALWGAATHQVRCVTCYNDRRRNAGRQAYSQPAGGPASKSVSNALGRQVCCTVAASAFQHMVHGATPALSNTRCPPHYDNQRHMPSPHTALSSYPVLLQAEAALPAGIAGLFGAANRALSKATSSFIGQVCPPWGCLQAYHGPIAMLM